MSIKVTVTDTETGDSETQYLREHPCAGNYVVLCGPGTELSHRQAHPTTGTEVLTLRYNPRAGSEPGIKREGKGQMEDIGPIEEPPPPPTQEDALEYYQHVPHHFERGATSLCRWCGRPECTPLHID